MNAGYLMNAQSHPPKVSSGARSKARRVALQALYQWQMTAAQPEELIAQYEADQAQFGGADSAYFEELVYKVIDRSEALDAQIAACHERKAQDVDPIEKAVLRIATYELAERLDVPYKVVINEAVALAKKFGAEQSHTFVNGILDKLAKTLRAVEHPKGQGGEVPGWGKSS